MPLEKLFADKFKRDKLSLSIMNLNSDDGKLILPKIRGGADKFRRVKEIELYKNLMINGKWTVLNELLPESTDKKLLFPFRDFLAEPLMFLKDGTLYEGRNRVIALSEIPVGLSVPFVVLLGLGKKEEILWNKWHNWTVTFGYRNTQFKRK
jgi:hypothetical protein